MKRIIAIAAVPLLLGGCFPLPVTIASTAISGISYLTTGKSSTDHVISAAVEQDCALTRPIVGEAVCKELDPNDPDARQRVIVAAHPGDRDDGDFPSMHDSKLHKGAMKLDELPRGPAQVAVAFPFVRPPHEPIVTPGIITRDESVAPVPTARPVTASAPARAWTPPEPVARLAVAPKTPSRPAPDVEMSRYVVIGSVRDADRAEDLRSRFDALDAEIRTTRIDGQVWNRVVVGPFAPEQARTVRAEMGTVHGKTPWIVRLAPKAEFIAMR